MKKVRILAALVLLVASQVLTAKNVDVEKSEIKWLGKKIAGEHYGEIQLKSADLEVKDNQIASGTFVVDMTTITNEDLTDEGSNAKLVGHLKSDDFFGVEKYPEAKLVVTKAAKFTNGKATVNGKITIKGTTEPISFDVVKKGDIYTAKISIDRSKFDVRYGSKTFFANIGDKAIDDIFILDVKLVVE